MGQLEGSFLSRELAAGLTPFKCEDTLGGRAQQRWENSIHLRCTWMRFVKTRPAAGLSSLRATQLQRSSTCVQVPRVRGRAGGSSPSAQGEGDGRETPVSIGLPARLRL